MCVTRVTAWAFAGRNYNSEIEAVRAAIDEIGKKIVRDHASHPGKGLVEHDDLPKLLLRYRELAVTTEAPESKAPEGTLAESLEGTRAEGTQEHHPDCAFLADPEHATCDCAGILGTAMDKDGNL